MSKPVYVMTGPEEKLKKTHRIKKYWHEFTKGGKTSFFHKLKGVNLTSTERIQLHVHRRELFCIAISSLQFTEL